MNDHSAQSELAVSVRSVSKTFSPSSRWLRPLIKSPITEPIDALRDVSFNVAAGEVCALVGPNGAGKTTLFKTLIGLNTPTTGSASVFGHDVVKESLAIRRQVGWMPTAGQTLFHRHTVADNLRFHGRVYGFGVDQLEREIDITLEQVGIARAKNQAVVSLSSGMNARLRLARTLLHDPKLLILDEPTASVDPVASVELIELILRIVEERSMSAIVSSHRLDEIEALGSHVLLLNRGSVLFDGPLHNLRDRIDRPHLRLEFTNDTSARSAALKLGSHPQVASANTEGRVVGLALEGSPELGSLLSLLGEDLRLLTEADRVEVPLRQLLAEVYGIADSREGAK